jgi:pimeloyl-ACP methyl ester carboxylesterase
VSIELFNSCLRIFGLYKEPLRIEETESETEAYRPSIILIHGAGATPNSFNYLKLNLPPADYFILSYDVNDGFYFNLERMISQLSEHRDREFHVVSHSLGGIYTLHIMPHLKLKSVVSIAAPFNGSSMADWARYMMPNYQLFRDVSTKAQPITQSKEISVSTDWTQIVTTRGGVPWIRQPNDGVVTIHSQMCRSDIDYKKVEQDHYEILVCPETVEIIRDKIFS